MSDRDIDNLFKSRLDDYSRIPSPRAWEQLEQKINRKKDHWKRYIAMVASLLLLIMATAIFVNRQSDSGSLASHSVDKKELIQEFKDEVLTQSPQQKSVPERILYGGEGSKRIKKEHLENQENVAIPRNEKIQNASHPSKGIIQEESTVSANNFKPESMKQIAGLGVTPFNMDEKDQGINELQMVEKGVFIAENDRGINMRKILNAARDLKTDNNAWATLREAKNNFLTLGNKNYEKTE